MNKTKYRKSYASSFSNYIQGYLTGELEGVRKKIGTIKNLESAYTLLRTLYLVRFVVVELYEKEYPDIAKEIKRIVPLLKQIDLWQEIIISYVCKNQNDGYFRLGGNVLCKNNDSFYYVSSGKQFFNIDTFAMVGYPPVIGLPIRKFVQDALKKRFKKDYVVTVNFQPETNLFEHQTNVLNKLYSSRNARTLDLDQFTQRIDGKFSISVIDDYFKEFDFIYNNISKNSRVIGYQKAFDLCKQRVKALSKNSSELRSYGQEFLKRFDEEYEKRVGFLILASSFVERAKKDRKNVWFLRDQIEPFLLKKIFARLDDKNSLEDDSLLLVSRNSTSHEPGDHYASFIIGGWYYAVAHKAKGSFKLFIGEIYPLFEKEYKKNPIFRKICNQVETNLLEQGVIPSKKKLHFIDTGFQGTFNVLVELVIRRWSKVNNMPISIDHSLMGIWPWLSGLLKGKYLTTYFPIVLIVEYFDGLHELAVFERLEQSMPLLKMADSKHQIAAFLDLILIHDVALILHSEDLGNK